MKNTHWKSQFFKNRKTVDKNLETKKLRTPWNILEKPYKTLEKLWKSIEKALEKMCRKKASFHIFPTFHTRYMLGPSLCRFIATHNGRASTEFPTLETMANEAGAGCFSAIFYGFLVFVLTGHFHFWSFLVFSRRLEGF